MNVRLSESLRQSIADYLALHYVEVRKEKRCAVLGSRSLRHRTADVCEMALPCADAGMPVSASLEELLKQADAGFSETLLRLIDKSGKKDSEVYKKANLSKQHFSKIRNNPDYKPTKPTAIALALALELDLEETRDLIGRAGFTLSNSSKFDLIIRFFIENRIYDVVQINMALYEFDQSLLGGRE